MGQERNEIHHLHCWWLDVHEVTLIASGTVNKMESDEELYLQLWLAKHGYEELNTSPSKEQPHWRYPMHQAAEEGNLRVLRLIKERGLEHIEALEPAMETTFQIALRYAKVDTITYLATYWNLFPDNTTKYAADLYVAVEFASVEVLEWLLAEGAKRQLQVLVALDGLTSWSSNRPASQLACLQGNLEKLKLVVKYGVDLGSQLSNEWLPHLIIESGSLECLKFLISLNIPIHPPHRTITWNDNALLRAVKSGKAEMVDWIFKHSGRGWSQTYRHHALLHAAKLGCLEVVIYLVKRAGSKIEATKKIHSLFSPFFLAVRFGHLEVARWLYSEGNAKLNNFKLPVPILTMAVQHKEGNENMVRWLIEIGAPLFTDTWNDGYSLPLHTRCYSVDYGYQVELPTWKPFDIEQQLSAGQLSDPHYRLVRMPPLCEAIRLDQRFYIMLLVVRKVPLFGTPTFTYNNATQAFEGHAAIFAALDPATANVNTLRYLLEEDFGPVLGPTADRIAALRQIEAKNPGENFFIRACYSKSLECIKYLITLGFDPHTETGPRGRRAIHIAAQTDNVELAEFLFSVHKVSLTQQSTDERESPMMIACSYRSGMMVRWLLAHGCDVDELEATGVPFERLECNAENLWLSSTGIIGHLIHGP